MFDVKSRIKKALFAGFKDEILDAVGYPIAVQEIQIKTKELEFTELRCEILLRDDEKTFNLPLQIAYEKALQNAKREMFEQVIKFIQVEEGSILDNHLYPNMAFKLSLFVGTKTLNK